MGTCAGHCASGHADSTCNLNTDNGGSSCSGKSTINFATASTSSTIVQTVSGSGQIIYDTDYLNQLISYVNGQIDRYNTSPRYDSAGNPIAFGGGAKLATQNVDRQIIKAEIWLTIVDKINSLKTAWGLTANVSRSPFDKADGLDLVNASTIQSLYNHLNEVSQTTGCGAVCKCNIVCSCNGNCGCVYSDETLKENIKPIEENILDSIQTVSYNFKDNPDKTKMYGVIAQSLIGTKFENTASLTKDEKGLYRVDYIGFIGPIIAEIQNLKKELNTAKEEIKTLKNELNNTKVFTTYFK